MFQSYKDIFQQRGQLYHEAMTTFPQAREEEFLQLLRYATLKKDSVLVDMPSGGCYLRSYLPEAKIYFVDSSKAFIEHCHNEQHVIHTTLEESTLKNDFADVVLSLAGMHHAENPTKIYEETHRILKVQGSFIYADVLKGSKEDTFLNTFVHAHNSLGHQGVFLETSIHNELEALNFEVEVCEYKTFTWNFTTEEEMLTFVKKLFGLDLASDEVLRKALGEILGYVKTDKEVKLKWGLLFTLAKKSG